MKNILEEIYADMDYTVFDHIFEQTKYHQWNLAYTGIWEPFNPKLSSVISNTINENS